MRELPHISRATTQLYQPADTIKTSTYNRIRWTQHDDRVVSCMPASALQATHQVHTPIIMLSQRNPAADNPTLFMQQRRSYHRWMVQLDTD